jgi:hypothetical protein
MVPDAQFEIGQLAWAMKIDTLIQRSHYTSHTEVSLLINFTVRDFFLASALKRSCHPPEKMFEFNVSGVSASL